MKKLLLTIAAVVGMFAAGSGNAWADTDAVTVKWQAPSTLSSSDLTYSDENGAITMTLGSAGKDETWSASSASTTVNNITFSNVVKSNNNPSPKNGSIPTLGTFVKYEPTYDGTIILVINNAGTNKTAYLLEVKSGESTASGMSATLIGTGSSTTQWTSGSILNSSKAYSGGVQFSVTAGNTYYFYLSGSNMTYNGFIFTYEADNNKVTVAEPVYTFNESNGKYTVTLSANPEDATISYTIGDNTYTYDADAKFEVDPKTSIKVSATKEGMTDSSVRTSTAPAKPIVASVTYSITPNTTARNYTITLNCATEGSAISYTIGEETFDYTAPFTVDPSTKISVSASKQYYTASESVTISTVAFPKAGEATTETLGAGGISWVDYSGFSVTFPSSYVAGVGSGNYTKFLKLRNTNKTDHFSTGFQLNVNEEYTISKVVVRGFTNVKSNADGATKTTVKSVAVDGVTLDDFTSVDLAFSDKYSSDDADAITLENLSATKSIEFESSNTNQVILQFDITFTLAEQPTPLTVTFDANVGYATLYSDETLIIPDDVKAYTGTISGESLVLNQVQGTYIPAETAVILTGENGSKSEFYSTTLSVAKISDNALKGVTEATSLTNVYVLSYKTGLEDVGFYKASSITLPANKAYVEWPDASNAPMLRFNFGETDEPGNVTGINAVTIENHTQNVIYDLRGRRVQSLDRPGLYIVNGKKVAIQ